VSFGYLPKLLYLNSTAVELHSAWSSITIRVGYHGQTRARKPASQSTLHISVSYHFVESFIFSLLYLQSALLRFSGIWHLGRRKWTIHCWSRAFCHVLAVFRAYVKVRWISGGGGGGGGGCFSIYAAFAFSSCSCLCSLF